MLLTISRQILLILGFLIAFAAGNAEKIIFTAPAPIPIPQQKPSLSDLRLPVLTPDAFAIRTNISRVFPPEQRDYASGAATWLLLDNLNAGQRYELRVCWAAIQPTGFVLEFYELDRAWDTPELMQSLAEYAYSRQPDAGDEDTEQVGRSPRDGGARNASVLLIQVKASADYFTDNAVLMKDPPPVLVDLILDPYLFNLVPRSLVPTIIFLLVVGLVAWFVARSIASKLQAIAVTTESVDKKKN
ncbi:hypothetical protein FDECE_14528 [Fusarium decemcellulare]|nr:hypothetical protein FDECE_14528 [Fusarium decemcellulare]